MAKSKGPGWFEEPQRHRIAALKGVEGSRFAPRNKINKKGLSPEQEAVDKRKKARRQLTLTQPTLKQSLKGRKKPAEKKPKPSGFMASSAGIDRRLAVDAHSGTSFSPEKRADQNIEGFKEGIQSFYEDLKKYAKTDRKSVV